MNGRTLGVVALASLNGAPELLAAVRAWRAIELAGEYDTPEWRHALERVRDVVDRIIRDGAR